MQSTPCNPSRQQVVVAAGTVGGAGTTVALAATLTALEDRDDLDARVLVSSAVEVRWPESVERVSAGGRARALLREFVGLDRADVYVGFADRLPLVRRAAPHQVLVVQNPHLYEPVDPSLPLSRKVKWWGLGWWARQSVRRADRIVCSTDASRRTVARASAVAESGIDVEPIPVQRSPLPRPERSPEITSLLTVGDAYGYKRIDLVIDAAAAFARQTDRAVTLTHLGRLLEAEAAARIRAAIGRAEADPSVDLRIELRGATPHDEVLEALVRHDVMVLLSTSETQGIPLQEAMAAGLPVVCHALDVFTEQGGDAVVAVSASPDDERDRLAREVAAAIALLDEPRSREELATRAMQRVPERNGWALLPPP